MWVPKNRLIFWNPYSIIILRVLKSEVIKVSPRTGRPKADNPKNVEVKVRFVECVNQQLLLYCRKHGITRAEAIRQAVDLLLTNEK